MNCECVLRYRPDPENPVKPLFLGRAIAADISQKIELYPVTVSVITTDTPAFATYDAAHGWGHGKKATLKTGDLVLFVSGKLHYMNKNTIKRLLSTENKGLCAGFDILHPAAEEIFFRDAFAFDE